MKAGDRVRFKDGETITVEPWRAKAFPILKDLVVDRTAFDRIISAGGYVSVNTGSAPEANSLPIARDVAESAMDVAQCIGCGACVAACKMTGIRAAICHDVYSAHQGVEHDDMNVICFGSEIIGGELALDLIRAFLGARFDGGERYVERLKKVEAMEKEMKDGQVTSA